MVLWWWGCAAPTAPTECPDVDPPTLSVGIGGDAFVPLTPGDELELEHGAQGGTHLTLSLRLGVDDWAAVPLVLSVDAEVLGDSCPEGCLVGQVTFALDPDYASAPTDDGWIFDGIPVVVTSWPADQARRLSLTLTDACGRAAQRSIDFEPLDLES